MPCNNSVTATVCGTVEVIDQSRASRSSVERRSHEETTDPGWRVTVLTTGAFLAGRSTIQAAGEQAQLHFLGLGNIGGLMVHYPALGKVYMYDLNTNQCKAAFRIPAGGAALVDEPCK